MILPILGLALHVEQGSEAGADAWFHNAGAQASAHFGNPSSGPLDQWVDTDNKAWAEVAGNSRWISVEHEGYSGQAPAPTDTQIENDADLLAWLHVTEGVPLQISDSPATPGLGWHGMGGWAWGGHFSCPGERILAARPAILARATELVHSPTPAPPAPATVPHWYHRVLYVARPYLLTGADVLRVQQHIGVRADGIYGPDTAWHVGMWQHMHGLSPDRIVGPQSATRMGP